MESTTHYPRPFTLLLQIGIYLTCVVGGLFFPAHQAIAQCTNPIFEFTFQGSQQNIAITCGKILNAAIWKVEDDTCIMVTDTIWLDPVHCSGNNNLTEVNITMDREGNQVNHDDFIINNIYCEGVLQISDTTWGDWVPESGNSNVRTNTYSVACSAPQFVIVEIIMGTNDPQASLKILSSNSCVSCYTPNLLPMDWGRLSANLRTDGQVAFALPLGTTNNPEGTFWLEQSIDGRHFLRARATLTVRNEYLSGQTHNRPTSVTYYRIGFRSPEGDTTYSNIAEVKPTPAAGYVAPNPINAGGTFQLQTPQSCDGLQLLHSAGQVIVSYDPLFANGQSPSTFPIPRQLSPGYYLLLARFGQTIQHYPIIVQ